MLAQTKGGCVEKAIRRLKLRIGRTLTEEDVKQLIIDLSEFCGVDPASVTNVTVTSCPSPSINGQRKPSEHKAFNS